jgi:dGTPase
MTSSRCSCSQPDFCPPEWQADVAAAKSDETELARIVADYVAGMTDRFAIQEHQRLSGKISE